MNKYTIKYSGNESPRPTICKDGKQLSVEEVVNELNGQREVIFEAWKIIGNEMNCQRTPYLLKGENGGKGFGYFENALL